MKHKKHSRHHEPKPRQIIPLKLFPQIKHRKNRKHRQRDHFLNRLQLRRRKFIRPDAIRRHLKTILKKRNPPTCEYHFPKSLAPIFQMPIPRKRHKNIRHGQKQNCSHVRSSSVRLDGGDQFRESGLATAPGHTQRCPLPYRRRASCPHETVDVFEIFCFLTGLGTCMETLPRVRVVPQYSDCRDPGARAASLGVLAPR
jgi:hypothetical protein